MTLEVTPEKVFIDDKSDLHGTTTITNDAEAVVEYLFKTWGNLRFIYCDTEGRWDELIHNKGRFLHFKPYKEEHP